MSRRFLSINLAKPMETVEQNPFVLCAWPSFADQPYITNYRIYDDRVGETTRFTYRPDHEWYWFPHSCTEIARPFVMFREVGPEPGLVNEADLQYSPQGY